MVSTLTGSLVTSQDTWFVDSGVSTHMIGYKDVLSDFRKKPYLAQVERGDEVKYEVKGVGSISFQLDSSSILYMEELIYVPGLKKNLLSVAILKKQRI